jgi:hypothetical protein
MTSTGIDIEFFVGSQIAVEITPMACLVILVDSCLIEAIGGFKTQMPSVMEFSISNSHDSLFASIFTLGQFSLLTLNSDLDFRSWI